MQNGKYMNEQVQSDDMCLIEVLFDHYFDSKTEDEPNIEAAYKEFCHSLRDVDPFQIDEIMSSAAALCLEHERAAFIAGIRTKVKLLRELSE